MSRIRWVLVIALLFVGAVAATTANAVVWANRTVFNTDEFVTTANRVLDDDEVQEEVATTLSARLVERAEVQSRLEERLPSGLEFLAPTLTRSAQELAHNSIIRFLNNDEIREVLDASLRLLHERVLFIIEGDSTVAFEDDRIVLDLKVLLERAAERLGVDREITLPEDAGEIVLVEDAKTANAVQDLVSLHDTITWLVVAVAAGAFALAVVASPSPRRTLRDSGLIIALCGLAAILFLFPLRPIVAGFAQNPGAARAIFDAFFYSYRLQSLLVVILGLGVVFIAALLGSGEFARAVRGRLRPAAGGAPAPSFSDAFRANGTLLRLLGLVAAAVALAAWPEPTNRVYWTVFLLLGAYMFILWLMTSTGDWAASARDRMSAAWEHVGGSSGERSYTLVGRNATWLRIAGVAIAVAVAIFIPNLGLGSLAAIVAFTLVYLAVIDWLSTSRA